MALSTIIYTVTSPTVAGTTASYTGVGFAPSAILNWECAALSDGTFSHAFQGYGVCIGTTPTTQMATSYSDEDGATSTNVASWQSQGRAFDQIGLGAGPLNVGTMHTLDADGFTVVWTSVAATSRVYNALCLGGADFGSAYIGTFQVVSSVGNQSITGVGFQPQAVLFFSSRPGTAGDGQSTGQSYYFGIATSSNQRHVVTVREGDAQANATSVSYQRTDKCIAQINLNGTLRSQADLTSMDADGFSLNWDSLAAGSTLTCYYAAFSGGQWQAGSFSQSTTTGNQSVTGIGFQPRAVLLRSFNRAATTGVIASTKVSFGGATASDNEAAIWSGTANPEQQANSTSSDVDEDRTKILKMIEPGTVPTVNSSADFTSNDSDGFSIDWATNDGTAREILYLAIGDSPSTAVAANDTDSYVDASF